MEEGAYGYVFEVALGGGGAVESALKRLLGVVELSNCQYLNILRPFPSKKAVWLRHPDLVGWDNDV